MRHKEHFSARPAHDGRVPWWAGAMTSIPDSTPDTADQPDELETADAPDLPDTTGGDDEPVDNPSGG